MRKFEVGQRVRIVRSTLPERIGVVTTITGHCNHVSRVYGGRLNCDGLECYLLDLPHARINTVPAHYQADSLAPIDDGHEKTTWAEMRKLGLWVPEGSEA